MAILIKVLISLIGIFSILGILAVRGSIYIWLLFISVITLTLQFTVRLGVVSSSLLWIAILSGLLIASKPVRQKLFSQKVLKILRRKRLLIDDPVVKTIEQNLYSKYHSYSWLETDLLTGNINWEKLLQSKEPELTAKEQSFLDNQVEELCRILTIKDEDPKATDLSNFKNFPQEGKIWEYLTAKNFLAILIPIKYGGLGFSIIACAKIIQKIATCNITVAVTVMRFNSLSLPNLILKYGTEMQREEYLPTLATGKRISAFLLASNISENNLNFIDNNAVISYGTYYGKRTLGVNLNWEKQNVIFAPIATLLGVMVDLYDPNNLLEGLFINNQNYSSDQKILGMTIFMVPTNLAGIVNDPNNVLSSQAEAITSGTIKGRDVFIPLDFIVGGKGMIGHGYKMIVDLLSLEQGIFFPALSNAISKVCLKSTSAYGAISKQLGLSTPQRCGIKTILSNISGYNYMLDVMQQLTLVSFYTGIYDSTIANIVKYRTADLSRKIINYSIEINDNNGNIFGLLNDLVQKYQNIPNNLSIYGSNLLLKNFITTWQSIINSHPFLKAEIMAVDTNDLALFDQNFFAHISYMLSNYAKIILHVVSNKLFCKSPTINNNKQLQEYGKKFNFFSKVLMSLIETSLWQYDFLLMQQNQVLSRLEEIFSYLYIGCAVIKNNSSSKDLETWIYTKWCLQVCLYNIEQTILVFLQNFPNRMLASVLRILIFGFNNLQELPDDRLIAEISNIIAKKSELRTKLLANCYVAEDDILEIAFQKTLSAKAVWSKVYLAEKSGIIPKDLNLNLKINIGIQEKIVTELEGILIREAEMAIKQVVTNN